MRSMVCFSEAKASAHEGLSPSPLSFYSTGHLSNSLPGLAITYSLACSTWLQCSVVATACREACVCSLVRTACIRISGMLCIRISGMLCMCAQLALESLACFALESLEHSRPPVVHGGLYSCLKPALSGLPLCHCTTQVF